MSRLSRLTQLSSVAVLFCIFASAGYMMYLVYSQYQVRERLQKSLLEHNLQEDEKKALAIGYFFSERLNDLSTLAESRELSLYYDNQALGMSLEYGLGATITSVEELLQNFRNKRMMGEHQIFARLAYAEASGKILFESRDREIFGKLHLRLPQGHAPNKNSAEFFYEKIGKDEYIVISFPFRYKGHYTGEMSGWIPVDLVYQHFVKTTGGGNLRLSFLMFPDRYLLENHDIRNFISPSSLPDPAKMKLGEDRTFSAMTLGGAPQLIHAFVTPVSHTPLALATFNRIGAEGSVPSPGRLLSILGIIGLALLTGGIAFYRVSMRSMALEVRLDETRIREKIVAENNIRLSKLLTALEQSSNSVIITDDSGSIEYVNPHFCKVTGYDAEEVMGKNPSLMRSGKEPPEKYRELWDTVLGGKCWSGEMLSRKKNGELFWEQSNIAPVINEHGVITSIIAIKEDITERKRAELELRKAKEAAEAASRAKSQFLANMSHEIRTPMNGVLGMLNLMIDSNVDEAQLRLTRMAHSSAEKLLSVINDILDFSKIEAGKLELQPVVFSIRDLAKEVMDLFWAKTQQKNISITLHIDESVPDSVEGDPLRIRQILINLKDNAVKFTEQGNISLAIYHEEETPDNVLLRVEVRDTGTGINPDAQQKIFDAFSQVDGSMTRRHEGTGLGLAISKQLVEMMGGKIGVESEPGKGSLFWFTVLLKHGHETVRHEHAAKEVAAAADKRMESRQLRVLLAEDNEVNQEVGRLILEGLDCLVEVVDDGRFAVEEVFSKEYDLVFMDCQMPDMDGYEATRIIRQKEAKIGGGRRRITIIALTAHAMNGDRALCLNVGMDDYLAKPFNAAQMGAILQKWGTLLS